MVTMSVTFSWWILHLLPRFSRWDFDFRHKEKTRQIGIWWVADWLVDWI